MNCLPDSMAASTSSHTAAMRFCIAFLPASTRYRPLIVTVRWRPDSVSKCWIFASSSLSITGKSSTICFACSGPASSRLRSGPSPIPIEVMTCSRMESSGGFVTCANCCVK